MSDLAAEARATPPRARDVRPGKFNRDGEFFDLGGNLLQLAESNITPARAQELVDAGARVAFEGCGCGGGWGG